MRTFLKPGVVRKASVINRRIGTKDDCIAFLVRRRRPIGKFRHRFRDRLLAAALDHTVDQRLAPAVLEALSAPPSSPKVAQAIVIAAVGLAAHQRQQPAIATGGIEGADQRLDETDRSIGSGDVGPQFERVRRRQMPGRGLRCFIEIEPEVKLERSTLHQSRKVEITRRCRHRIRVENDQRTNLPSLKIRRQLGKRPRLASGRG